MISLKEKSCNYIVFTNSDLWWLQAFLKKGFQHCYILKNDGINWIKIESSRKVISTTILPYKPDDNIHERMAVNNKVVKVEVNTMLMASKWRLRLFNCVEVVKSNLGLDLFALTPYKLYKRLRRHDHVSNPKFSVKYILGNRIHVNTNT